MEPKSKSRLQNTGYVYNTRTRKYVIVAILFLLILSIISGYLVIRELFFKSERVNSYFTVVLDCGSTGSRVNVYEWMIGNGSEVYGKLPILVHSYPENVNKSSGCQYHCVQTEPGVHNFVDDEFRVRASIETLITYAEQLVPLELHAVTPIFVLATAGMRRLAAVDAEHVLKNVKNIVKEHGFHYKKSWIRVLSGKEEAYYGWVALNYEKGVFGSALRLPTLGLLDLGGSSLQVVAEVDASLEDEHTFRSNIGPVEYDIAAHSLPAFGLNEAFDRTIVMLSHTQALRQNAGGMFEIRHRCLGSGFFQNYTCHGCFGLDSFSSRNMSNQVQDIELNFVFLVGEQNWEECKMLSRSAAINLSRSKWSHQVDRTNCIGLSSYGGFNINLTKTSHTVKCYHALSGFFTIYHSLNLSQRANLTAMWELGQRLCSRSLDDQTSIIGQYCFRLPYLAALIENALCLNDVEIIFGPGNISWTLGASLIEGDFLWHSAAKSQYSILNPKNHETIFSPLFTFLLLLLLLLIVYFCQIKLPVLGRKVVVPRTSLPSYLCPKGQPD